MYLISIGFFLFWQLDSSHHRRLPIFSLPSPNTTPHSLQPPIPSLFCQLSKKKKRKAELFLLTPHKSSSFSSSPHDKNPTTISTTTTTPKISYFSNSVLKRLHKHNTSLNISAASAKKPTSSSSPSSHHRCRWPPSTHPPPCTQPPPYLSRHPFHLHVALTTPANPFQHTFVVSFAPTPSPSKTIFIPNLPPFYFPKPPLLAPPASKLIQPRQQQLYRETHLRRRITKLSSHCFWSTFIPFLTGSMLTCYHRNY